MKNGTREKTSILKKNIGGKPSDGDLAFLCSRLGALIRAGVQITDCIRITAGQEGKPMLAEVLGGVASDLRGGMSVAGAFEKRGAGVLEPFFFETIRAGENSGDLAAAFDTLRSYYRNRSRLRKQIRNALVYPVFVLIVAAVVLAVIMVYVMPKLTDIFRGMGGEIPGVTGFLIDFSDFFSENILLIALAAAALIAGAVFTARTQWGREKLDRIKLRAPLFGKVAAGNNTVSFASTLSMLLHSGVMLRDALAITCRVIKNSEYRRAVEAARSSVEAGRGMSRAMRSIEVFPGMLTECCAIGEKYGQLEYMLKVCEEHYREETESLVKRLLTLLEPALLIMVALFAGFIVFAVYIPLFQMYDLF